MRFFVNKYQYVIAACSMRDIFLYTYIYANFDQNDRLAHVRRHSQKVECIIFERICLHLKSYIVGPFPFAFKSVDVSYFDCVVDIEKVPNNLLDGDSQSTF